MNRQRRETFIKQYGRPGEFFPMAEWLGMWYAFNNGYKLAHPPRPTPQPSPDQYRLHGIARQTQKGVGQGKS